MSTDDDSDWNSEVALEVGPHPVLSEEQAKVIALDYGIQGGKAKIKGATHAALLCAETVWARH